jgi:two-component system chemotaxis response regulator CheY
MFAAFRESSTNKVVPCAAIRTKNSQFGTQINGIHCYRSQSLVTMRQSMAHILIVDDSAFARRVLRGMLEPSGHAVLEAEGGMRALEQYALHKPDLVFLDQIMDDMNGLDVLGKLKELDPRAKVVIATADVQSSTEQEAMRRGACAVIIKPFPRDGVFQALQTALQ